jgi:succinate dehydrogenase / fumarate reductase, membrane anchor subunit
MAERIAGDVETTNRATDREPERTTWTPSNEAGRPAWGWILQAITGVAVLFLLALHMIANHFMVSRGLRDTADVSAYFSNPLIVALEVTFLVTVTWHGLLGLRSIIFDFGFSPRTERRITWILTVVGTVAVVYGIWLTAVIVSRG